MIVSRILMSLEMADSTQLQLGEQCPLCRKNGQKGRLELRQINAFEALWICGNLAVSHTLYRSAPVLYVN